MLELISAVVGLFIGHTADLLFDRLYRDEPIGGRVFRCRGCRGRIGPLLAIPIVGVLTCRFRCPVCGERLPLRSLALPVASGALFLVSTLVFGQLGAGLLGGLFATVSLVLSFTDLDRRLLPNRLLYPATVLAMATCWAWPDRSAVQMLGGGFVAIGVAGLLLLFSLPFGAGAFGMGDVKMIVFMGFVTGLPSVIVGVFIGMVSAAAFAVLLLVLGLRKRRDYIPHGPFLALGTVIAMFWGLDIWHAYTR